MILVRIIPLNQQIYSGEIIWSSYVGRDYREHEGGGQPTCLKAPAALLFDHILAIYMRYVSSLDSTALQSVIKVIRLLADCLAGRWLSIHGFVRGGYLAQ